MVKFIFILLLVAAIAGLAGYGFIARAALTGATLLGGVLLIGVLVLILLITLFGG